MPLAIVAAQPEVVAHDVVANVATHAAVVRAARVRVVVFPELSLTGYELDAAPVAVDDPRLGPLVAACAEVGAVALVGAPVAEPDGEHIAMLAVDGAGARVAYRKLYPADDETPRFVPGNGPAVLEVDGVRLGLAICRDTGIAEHAARTSALGIDAYVAGVLGSDAATVAERAVRIARTHGVPVVIASHAGAAGGSGRGAGRSGVWGSDGTELARVGDAPGDGAFAGLVGRGATHEDLTMSGTASASIASPPAAVYAAVTDLTRMGEWSPENRGGAWVDGEPGCVGATFRGVNEDADGPWDTSCTVIEAVPDTSFAWRVADPGDPNGTEWRFTFRPDGAGTEVTETFTWRWTPHPDEGFRGRVGRMPIETAAVVVAGREHQLRGAITTTVGNLAASLDGC